MKQIIKVDAELPYDKVERFELDGQSYPTEEAAIKAAVGKVLGNPGVASSVLTEACALAPLLARHCQLLQAAGR
jgi:hypothetical protein